MVIVIDKFSKQNLRHFNAILPGLFLQQIKYYPLTLF